MFLALYRQVCLLALGKLAPVPLDTLLARHATRRRDQFGLDLERL